MNLHPQIPQQFLPEGLVQLQQRYLPKQLLAAQPMRVHLGLAPVSMHVRGLACRLSIIQVLLMLLLGCFLILYFKFLGFCFKNVICKTVSALMKLERECGES